MATYCVKFAVDRFTGSINVNSGSAKEAEEYVRGLHPHQASMHFDAGQIDKDEAEKLFGNRIANPHVPNSHVIEGSKFKEPIRIVSTEKYISEALKAIMAEHGLVEKT